MKKWFVACVLIIGVSLWILYLIIPPKLIITSLNSIRCTIGGSSRYISAAGNWRSLSPDSGLANVEKDLAGPCFPYGPDIFCFDTKLSNGANITIKHNELIISGTVELFQISSDSVSIRLQCVLPSTNNPFTKISRYQTAVKIKKELTAIASQCKQILENSTKVYHFPIVRSGTNDSFLITTKTIVRGYPSTETIYKFIAQLKNYAKKKSANQTGYPMLNITGEQGNRFQVMVALPVDKILPQYDSIFSSNLVRGNFMTTEVTGGRAQVEKALDQLRFYCSDYGKTAMAIPFQSLITDRSKQPDTTKWVTRISAPVIR